jgi:hypothetical protein
VFWLDIFIDTNPIFKIHIQFSSCTSPETSHELRQSSLHPNSPTILPSFITTSSDIPSINQQSHRLSPSASEIYNYYFMSEEIKNTNSRLKNSTLDINARDSRSETQDKADEEESPTSSLSCET